MYGQRPSSFEQKRHALQCDNAVACPESGKCRGGMHQLLPPSMLNMLQVFTGIKILETDPILFS